MSGRSRAHPWWATPLPPFGGAGDGSITVRMAAVCLNCGETITGHFMMRCDDWYSPLLCKRPRHATEEGVVWAPSAS